MNLLDDTDLNRIKIAMRDIPAIAATTHEMMTSQNFLDDKYNRLFVSTFLGDEPDQGAKLERMKGMSS